MRLKLTKPLRPVPQVSITSDRLRQIARELIIQAEALDALVDRPKTMKRNVQLIDPRKCHGDQSILAKKVASADDDRVRS